MSKSNSGFVISGVGRFVWVMSFLVFVLNCAAEESFVAPRFLKNAKLVAYVKKGKEAVLIRKDPEISDVKAADILGTIPNRFESIAFYDELNNGRSSLTRCLIKNDEVHYMTRKNDEYLSGKIALDELLESLIDGKKVRFIIYRRSPVEKTEEKELEGKKEDSSQKD